MPLKEKKTLGKNTVGETDWLANLLSAGDPNANRSRQTCANVLIPMKVRH